MYKLRVLIALSAILIQVAYGQQNGDDTCVILQNCQRTEEQKDPWIPCGQETTDPVNVHMIKNPDYKTFYAPGPVNRTAQNSLYAICPYLATTPGQIKDKLVNETVCCNDDQVAIMTSSFQQIDSVFGLDVPICGVNLKKMWCEYTCNPTKTNFVNGIGEKTIEVGGANKTFTEVMFSVDEDMACTLFQSCQKVALIAQASLQSSKSFLDFLGVNGQNQSLTIITFDFNKSESLGSAGKCGANIPKEQRRYLVDNNLGTVAPLDLKMYDCGYPIPEDGHLDGYPTGPSPTSVLPPVSCTFCDEVCQAPDIDATIGFFDGCNWTAVWISYLVVCNLTVLWQLYLHCVKNPRVQKQMVQLLQEESNESLGITSSTFQPKDINITPEREINQYQS